MKTEIRWWLVAILLWALAIVLFKAQLRLEASGAQFVTRATIHDAGTNDDVNVYLELRFPDGSGVVVAADGDLEIAKFLRQRGTVRLILEDVEE